jgi:hypothetical protein
MKWITTWTHKFQREITISHRMVSRNPLCRHGQAQHRPSDGPRLIDGIDDRTSDVHSQASTTQWRFRDDIISRDGTCIMTNEPPVMCHACHFLPHSKGDVRLFHFLNLLSSSVLFFCSFVYELQYIQSVTQFRCQSQSDVLDDICDVRNGVLLYVGLHGPFGRGKMVFMKVRYLQCSVMLPIIHLFRIDS